MYEEEKREKLDRLHRELDKYKGKKDQYSINQAKKIRLEIKNTKDIVTHEEFEIMMSERSEINTSRC